MRTFRTAFICAIAMSVFCLSCTTPLDEGKASVLIQMTIPDLSGAEGNGTARLIRPDTVSLLVTVSGEGMDPLLQTVEIAPGDVTVSITVPGLEVSELERIVSVDAMVAGDLVYAHASSSLILKEGVNALSLILAPTRYSATYSGPGRQVMVPPADTTYVFRLLFTDDSEYAVSIGYGEAEIRVYDGSGRLAQRVDGTQERWYLLSPGASREGYLMIQGTGAPITLAMERACFVVPGSGGGTGTRADPYQGLRQADYDAASANCRFLLAVGDYPVGSFVMDSFKSLYGGFQAGSWTRSVAPGGSWSRLGGNVGPTGVIAGDLAAGSSDLDGVWVSMNDTSDPAGAIDYNVANFVVPPNIRNCRITGPTIAVINGTGATFTLYALRFSEVNPGAVISNNLISPGCVDYRVTNGTVGYRFYGIYRENTPVSACLIAGNEIDGGYVYGTGTISTMTYHTGMRLEGQCIVVNNTVDGGASRPVVGSNTIYAYQVTAVGSLPNILCNNVFFTSETSASSASVWIGREESNFSLSMYLLNNYFIKQDNMYYWHYFRNGVGNLNAVPGVNSVQDGFMSTFSFASFAAYPALSTLPGFILDRDLRLSAVARVEARASGHEETGLLSAGVVLTYMPYIHHDRYGTRRTPGAWSMGAYQFNP